MTISRVFKKATLTPRRVLAADSAEFVLTLTIGKGYTAGPSRLVFDFPATVGMSRPSLLHQEDHGYIEVVVSNPAVSYTKRNWDMEVNDFASREKTSWRGMAQRLFVLDLTAGLRAGDTISMVWGATGRGYGPGAKASMVVPCPNYQALLHVRYFDDPQQGVPDHGRSYKGYERPVPKCELPLSFEIRARPPCRLRLIRQTSRALLVPLDPFWNVAPVRDPARLVEASGAVPTRNAMGAFEYADKRVQVRSRKLPLLDGPLMDNVFEGLNIYWGDVHTHSRYSIDCLQREKLQRTPGDLFVYARQSAGLDFCAVTDHHRPTSSERARIGQAAWDKTLEDVRAHNRPGEFLAFPGIEWSDPRGDTAVVFGWLPAYEEIDRPDWTDLRALWQGFAGRPYLTIPHFHAAGRLGPDEWWANIESGVEPVLEFFSCHGSYEREDVLEHKPPMSKTWVPHRNAAYLLGRGYRYGLVCNSDGHKGHVGLNGVTAVYAPALEPEAIFAAYRQRHVYGTTNARLRLLFTGNGRLMGDVLPNTPRKVFRIEVAGEWPLKKIDLFRNLALYRQFLPDGREFRTELTVEDDAPSNWYVRATQADNQVACSSPIWFE